LIRHLLRATLAVALISLVALPPASSRVWKSTPDQIAKDYLTINDTRPGGELVLLMWFAPPMVRSDMSGAEALRPILEKYVILMAVHGNLDKASGTLSFEDIETLQANDQTGKPLKLLMRDNLPPATAGIVAVVEGMLRQSLGTMGKGMKVFVFEAGGVGACKDSGLSIPLAGETYTWKTPVPGCAQKG
jgi:hypothetical protein